MNPIAELCEAVNDLLGALANPSRSRTPALILIDGAVLESGIDAVRQWVAEVRGLGLTEEVLANARLGALVRRMPEGYSLTVCRGEEWEVVDSGQWPNKYHYTGFTPEEALQAAGVKLDALKDGEEYEPTES